MIASSRDMTVMVTMGRGTTIPKNGMTNLMLSLRTRQRCPRTHNNKYNISTNSLRHKLAQVMQVWE